MCWAKLRAEPFSGTRPRAEKGHWSQAVVLARTMSAIPGTRWIRGWVEREGECGCEC
jgi:hypothetical protein